VTFSKKDAARLLEVGAVVGVGALVLQWMALGAHLESVVTPTPVAGFRGISVLKPLCGVDDGLEENLERFASDPYPHHELILGLEKPDDPAAPIAQRVRARHPDKVKIVLKKKDVGLGPKINQLAEIVRAANPKFSVLLISDSNIRPAAGYYHELNRAFADPRVGCAWNPIVGAGHKTPGAMFDNMQVANVTGQVLAVRALTGATPIVKTYAVRRSALASIGGFEPYGDILAEDYTIGRDIHRRGWKVVALRTPIYNWTEKKTMDSFHQRWQRWGAMQATAEGPGPALAAGLMNPIPMALGALVLGGSLPVVGAVVAAKTALDVSTAKALGLDAGLSEALTVPIKDLALGVAQFHGFFDRTVTWRGKPPVEMGPGTRLTRVRSPR